MAGPGLVTPDQIRAGQEAMARAPGVAGTVQAGLIEDMNNGIAQAGLEKAALRTASFPAIRSLEENNNGHRDNLGNIQRVGNEPALHNTATNRIDLLEAFINNGFDHMGPYQATILQEVRTAIEASPEMSSRFATLIANGQQVQVATESLRMAQEYLRDPNFRGTVIELLMRRADLSHPITDNVTEIAIKLADLNAERLRITQAGGEQPVAVANETGAQNRLNRYMEDSNGVAANNGVFYTEVTTQTTARNNAKNVIQTLETNTIPNHDAQIQSLQLQEQQIFTIQSTYEAKKHPNPNYVPANPVVQNDPNQWLTVDQFITSLGLPTMLTVKQNLINTNTQLNAARTSLATEKTHLSDADARIAQINEEKGRAELNLKDAQAKRAEIDARVAKLDKDINEQTAKYNKTQAEKELQETKWVTELDAIISEATAQRLHEELPSVAQMAKTRLEKDAADAKTNNEKRFLERLTQRYFNGQFEPQRQNIDGDFTRLMASARDLTFVVPDTTPGAVAGSTRNVTVFLDGSGLALARALGYADVVPGETPVLRAERMQRIYDQVNNAEFRTGMSSRVAQEILTARLMTGHLSKAEVQAIEKSSWGPGMVAKALEGKVGLQKTIDGLVGKGVLNWGDNLGEQLKKLDWTKMLMILLAIAGIIGVVAVVKKG
jgi:hypothetical protein